MASLTLSLPVQRLAIEMNSQEHIQLKFQDTDIYIGNVYPDRAYRTYGICS